MPKLHQELTIICFRFATAVFGLPRNISKGRKTCHIESWPCLSTLRLSYNTGCQLSYWVMVHVVKCHIMSWDSWYWFSTVTVSWHWLSTVILTTESWQLWHWVMTLWQSASLPHEVYLLCVIINCLWWCHYVAEEVSLRDIVICDLTAMVSCVMTKTVITILPPLPALALCQW